MPAEQHRTTWDTYGHAWAQPDPAERAALLETCLSSDCIYSDPGIQTTGHAQLSDYMAGVQHDVPGLRFVITEFASHHDRSLAHWSMVDGEGTELTPGVSYGWYGDDGKLLQMTGFFGAPSH